MKYKLHSLQRPVNDAKQPTRAKTVVEAWNPSFHVPSSKQTVEWHVNRNSEISDAYWILRGKATTCKTNKEMGGKH